MIHDLFGYTIQADKPEFLIPFTVRTIDGNIECTYQLGNSSKLLYRFGQREPMEYLHFWEEILRPLLDCDDWFMNPFSFLLDMNYLYTDMSVSQVYYIYIPSKEPCADYDTLQALIREMAQKNPVSNDKILNKILIAIMQGVTPKDLLELMKTEVSRSAELIVPQPVAKEEKKRKNSPNAVKQPPVVKEKAEERQAEPIVKENPVPVVDPVSGVGDIIIDFSGSEKKSTKSKGGLFGGGKKEKKEKPKKEKKPLFGKKKQADIMIGSIDAPEYKPPVSTAPIQEEPQNAYSPAPIIEEDSGVTQIDDVIETATGLRYSGHDSSMPSFIPVNITPGSVFTIGRFDVTYGKKQSDFEFPKSTKAVSRHHAAIERTVTGQYLLADDSSSAGTFVNGAKLMANVPCELHLGDRIQFGNGGADYIWEETN